MRLRNIYFAGLGAALILLVFMVVPGDPESFLTGRATKEGATMSSNSKTLEEAFLRLSRGTPEDFEMLLRDLASPDFLNSLDDPLVYQQRRTPPNLRVLLGRTAASKGFPNIPERLVTLAKRKEYSPDDLNGGLRRSALVEAMGETSQPSPYLIHFLENEIIVSGRYRSAAVASLARIGSLDAISVLRRRIFDPKTSVIPPNDRPIYGRNYAIEVAQYRNRPPILAFLINDLFQANDLKRTVGECLVKDTVALGADPALQFQMAPLRADTPGAIALAQQLAQWTIRESQVLDFLNLLPDISRRITDLLGQPKSLPPSAEKTAVHAWVISVFQNARDTVQDLERRKSLETALAGLR